MADFNDRVILNSVSNLSILESTSLEFFATYKNANYINYLKLSYNNIDICTINCSTHTTGTNIKSVTDLSNYKDDILSHFSFSLSLNFNVTMWSVNTDNEISESSTQTVTIYLDSTLASPTIDPFYYRDVNTTTIALTNDNKKIINGFSQLQLYDVVAHTKENATIVSWSTQVGTKIITGTPSNGIINFGLVPLLSNNTITLIVKDSRGLITTKSVNYAGCGNYLEPNITECVLTRPTSGDGLNISLSGTFTDDIGYNVMNTITKCRYRYREISSSTWSDYMTFANMDESIIPVTIDGNKFYYEDVLDYSHISDDYNYEIQLYIEDNLSSCTYNDTSLRIIPLVSEGFGRVGINTSSPNASIDIRTTDNIYLIDNIDYHISEDEFYELESLSGMTWKLSIEDDSSQITVNRVASTQDGAIGIVVDGDIIYYDDVLTITSISSSVVVYINDSVFDYTINRYTATKGNVKIVVA